MEIIPSINDITFKISTEGVDFDELMTAINQIPFEFRSNLIHQMGISLESFYLKKRAKSFKHLEIERLTELTGLDYQVFTNNVTNCS